MSRFDIGAIAALLLASATPIPAGAADGPTLSSAQNAILGQAKLRGAADVTVRPAPGGGFIINGKLEGDQFALAFPAGWNGDGLLFAHGYSTPGSSVAVSEDPVRKDPSGGMLGAAYADGFAVGHSAYDKAGMGVETATRNTLRLRDFLVKLGAKRIYVSGVSMGGNVVLSLIEQHPMAFAGALSGCGVVDGWESLFSQLNDMRAAYNFLTAGTPYTLPGEQDVRRSALPTASLSNDPMLGDVYRFGQMTKLAAPVIALLSAAAANPEGNEARIVAQVAAIGGFEPEPGSLILPLVTVALASDDLNETFGGQIYSNIGKIYTTPTMTSTEAAALNEGIQRVARDPIAVTNARRWHQATGAFSVPLVTLHNRIDSLVPYSQEQALARIVTTAGNEKLLVQYTVPEVKAPLPLGGFEGYTHCGFKPQQIAGAWEALREWVETGKRPASDAVK